MLIVDTIAQAGYNMYVIKSKIIFYSLVWNVWV
jgi:hypothetical protein